MEEVFEKCHNCFWWECFVCDGADNERYFNRCNRGLMFDSTEYDKYHDMFQQKIDEALLPIQKEFEVIFLNYKPKDVV